MKMIVRIDGGLVNKMLAYMSSKVLANLLQKQLCINWTDHLHGLCHSLMILFEDAGVLELSDEEYKSELLQLNHIFSKEEIQKMDSFIVLENNNFAVKEFYLEIKPNFLSPEIHHKEMTKVWQELKIKKEILQMVPLVPSNSITVHIRKNHVHINISMQTYEAIIESEIENDSNVKIFLTTDNLEDKTHLISKYPNNCFTNNTDFSGKSHKILQRTHFEN